MSGRGREFRNAGEAVQHLKKTLADRKIQEQRQKLVNDHILIHSRKKNDLCVPILPGHDQKAWFEKLENNEIWEKVLEYLTHPSDITSAYFACDMFKKHLEQRRKMMMVPKVFGVLRDTGILDFPYVVPESGLGHFQYWKAVKDAAQNRKEVLNQRLVSKFWKKTAEEEFLEVPLGLSQPDWYLKWPKNDAMVIERDSHVPCTFKSAKGVEKALEILQKSDTTSCASLMRLIAINDDLCNSTNKEILYSKLEELLDKHGDAVWGLTFHFHTGLNRNSNDFNYQDLWGVVSKLPNLKALCLIGNDELADLREPESRLRQMLVQFPFPRISSSERCDFKCCPALSDSIVVEILSQNDHLKSLKLDWANSDNSRISDRIWDSLRSLSLEYFHLKYEVGHIFADHFSQLRQYDWPLKFLFVTHYWKKMMSLDPSEFFAVLNKFKDSLEEVSVQPGWNGMKIKNIPTRLCLDFPMLREMDLPHINHSN